MYNLNSPAPGPPRTKITVIFFGEKTASSLNSGSLSDAGGAADGWALEVDVGAASLVFSELEEDELKAALILSSTGMIVCSEKSRVMGKVIDWPSSVHCLTSVALVNW